VVVVVCSAPWRLECVVLWWIRESSRTRLSLKKSNGA
jgi:hypothetical protein